MTLLIWLGCLAAAAVLACSARTIGRAIVALHGWVYWNCSDAVHAFIRKTVTVLYLSFIFTLIAGIAYNHDPAIVIGMLGFFFGWIPLIYLQYSKCNRQERRKKNKTSPSLSDEDIWRAVKQ